MCTHTNNDKTNSPQKVYYYVFVIYKAFYKSAIKFKALHIYYKQGCQQQGGRRSDCPPAF